MDDNTSIEFAVGPQVRVDGNFIIRTGKIFEAGDYPDKKFALNADEMRAACTNFQPVALNVEHVPTIFDLGDLGRVERVWDDGVNLSADVAVNRHVDAYMQQHKIPLKVSAEWDRELKTLSGLALVKNPRVTDAAIMAAFAAHKEAGDSGRKAIPMTVWEKIKAAFSEAGITVDDQVDDKPAPAPVATMSADATAKFAAMEKQIADQAALLQQQSALLTATSQAQMTALATQQAAEADRRIQAAFTARKLYPATRAEGLRELAKTSFAEFSIRMDEIEKGPAHFVLGGYSGEAAAAAMGALDETAELNKLTKERVKEKQCSFSEAAAEVMREHPDLARAVHENRPVALSGQEG